MAACFPRSLLKGPAKGCGGRFASARRVLRRVCEEIRDGQSGLQQPAAPQGGRANFTPALPQMAGPQGPGAGMAFNRNGLPGGIPPLQTQIEAGQERLFTTFNAVSMYGSRFAQATESVYLRKNVRGGYENDICLPGWPLNLYREITGDLESTALAAYALRIVAERYALPPNIDFPQNISITTEFSTREALAAALVAVAQAQRKDGSWDEMVVWRPVDEFRNGAEGQFGPVVFLPKRVPSQSPPIATAQACAAMEDLLAALDHIRPAKAVRSRSHAAQTARRARAAKPPKPIKLADPAEYREQIAKGRRRLLELIAQVLSDQAKGLVPDANAPEHDKKTVGRRRMSELEQIAIDPVWGGIVEPYAMVCQLRLNGSAGPAAVAGEGDQNDPAAQTFIASAESLQMPEGLWPGLNYRLQWTPSLRERLLFLTANAPAETLSTKLKLYRFDDNANEQDRLATVHMLHYLSGALSSPAPAKSSAAGDKPHGTHERPPSAKRVAEGQMK